MNVSITHCEATPTSIKLTFSETVDGSSGKYTVYDPEVQQQPFNATLDATNANVVTLKPSANLTAGGRVLVSVAGVTSSGISVDPLAIGAVVKSALRIVNCVATTSLVAVYFSETLNRTNIDSFKGDDPNFAANYSVQIAGGGLVTPNSAIYIDTPAPESHVTYLEFDPDQFERGQELIVTAQKVTDIGGGVIGNSGSNTFFTRVNGGDHSGGKNGGKRQARELTESVEDAVAYPVLTEQVSFPSASGGGSIAGYSRSAQGMALGQAAVQAVTDVLGWKANASDPKGFIGALTQAFTLTEVEGHVEATWNPRTYAVQTDLGGGITGAQASLYTRAKTALDECLPLLDGLYPLDPDADPEYVKALRDLAKSQITAIVSELGMVGGPSVLRVNTYFGILLNTPQPITFGPAGTAPEFDPDQIGGTLGQLRDTYGIYFQKNGQNNPFSNSIEDEQDVTNFRVVSDYVTSLLQSWISNGQFFVLGSASQPAFFGTQLVLISRQFSVISETVNELRFAFDSVFIGPSERQTLLLQFLRFPNIFLEDMLREIETFVTQEGPGLLQDGGRISVTNNILPVIKSFEGMVREARRPANIFSLPDGYRTIRVQRAVDDLRDQLGELISLVQPVSQQVPAPIEQPQVPAPVAIPPAVNFGSVSGTSNSPPPQPVTIMNFGNSPVTVTGASIGGPDFQDFKSVSSLPATLAPQLGTAVAVTFTPWTSSKTSNATLTITYQFTGPDGKPRSGTLTPIRLTGITVN
jgi:hypothetical protein